MSELNEVELDGRGAVEKKEEHLAKAALRKTLNEMKIDVEIHGEGYVGDIPEGGKYGNPESRKA